MEENKNEFDNINEMPDSGAGFDWGGVPMNGAGMVWTRGMLEEKKSRLILYGAAAATGFVLNLANYLLYLTGDCDGTVLLYASLILIPVAVLFAIKLRFWQGLIASACIAFPSVIFFLIENLTPIGDKVRGGFLYGLGWYLSIIIWVIGALACFLVIGGIAAIVRLIKKKNKTEVGADA